MKRQYVELVWIYVVFGFVYGLLALLLLFPFHPITLTGWVIWFVAALPVTIAGEAIGSAVFNRKTGRAIDPSVQRVSVGRIGYGVVAALLLLFVVFFVVYLLGAAGGEFWERNFSDDW